MEITPSLIYWITRLDGFVETCTLLAAATFVAAILAGAFFFSLVMDEEDKTNTQYICIKRLFISLVASCVIFWTSAGFIPSTKEMAAIKVIPKIANSERIQNISNELCDLAVDWLKDLKKGNTHE